MTQWLPELDYLFWFIVAATVAGILVVIVAFRKNAAPTFGEYGEGILGVATLIAFIAAAWLYYLEGRDRPKVNIAASATVVGMAPPGSPSRRPLERVLVQISISIENDGERGHWFNCAALDLIALRGGEGRAARFPDDLEGKSLLEIDPGAPEDPVWNNCVGAGAFEEQRRQRELQEQAQRRESADFVNPSVHSGTPGSGARYRDFYMEPGERTTRTWEQTVSCEFNALRVIFKLPKPGGTADYETKLLVPIADVCRGERIVSTVVQSMAD